MKYFSEIKFIQLIRSINSVGPNYNQFDSNFISLISLIFIMSNEYYK